MNKKLLRIGIAGAIVIGFFGVESSVQAAGNDKSKGEVTQEESDEENTLEERLLDLEDRVTALEAQVLELKLCGNFGIYDEMQDMCLSNWDGTPYDTTENQFTLDELECDLWEYPTTYGCQPVTNPVVYPTDDPSQCREMEMYDDLMGGCVFYPSNPYQTGGK